MFKKSKEPKVTARRVSADPSLLDSPAVTSDDLASLAKRAPHLRGRIASHPGTDADTLVFLAQQPDGLTYHDETYGISYHTGYRLDLASRTDATTGPALRVLAADRVEDVRKAVAANPAAPADALALLANDSGVRRLVLMNPGAPADVLRGYTRSTWGNNEAETVAGNPSAPADVLTELAADERPQVRAAVATNPSTSVDLLRRFSRTAEASAVAVNPATPTDVLEEMALRGDPAITRLVATNVAAAPSVLAALASSGDTDVRLAVAANTSASGDTLRDLTANGDEEVVLAVAQNPSAPGELLQDLASDPYTSPRVMAAVNARVGPTA